MNDYESYINKLADEGRNEIFYNSSDAHAAIVLRALAKHAKKEIRILCKNMCTDVSNNKDYLSLLEKFLRENSSHIISVLFTDYSDSFCDLPVGKLFQRYGNQVTLRALNNISILYNEKPVHFTVVDGIAFRIETDIDNKMAFGNFNSPEQAKVLDTVFQTYSARAEHLPSLSPCLCAI
ncbi:MAG: hypothetical protein LBM62_02160 [Mediterranea sp.]|jgi:hypothetical protein|nr:hypothetical protein [Mediterranea sp.]